MNNDYLDVFYISDNLTKSISIIISEKEKTEYVCKKLSITIPAHAELAFHSPLEGYNAWGGGLNALSGAQIGTINEKYGRYEEVQVPAESDDYFVIINKKYIDSISKLALVDEKAINNVLKSFCVYFDDLYEPLLDPTVLYEHFPYLEKFFEKLNKWRAQTGRFTLDDDVLEKSIIETLRELEIKSKKNKRVRR